MGILLVVSLVVFAEDPASPDYSSQILPILREHCLGCHQGEEAEAGLRMDRAALLLAGGTSGPSLVPGRGEESLLWQRVSGQVEPRMPPEDSPPLSEEQITLLKAWIDAGAPTPAEDRPAELITPKIPVQGAPRLGISAAAISPTNGWLAIARHQQVLLLDPETGWIERSWMDLTGPVTSLTFTPDGNRVIVAAGEPGLSGEASLWDVSSGRKLVHIVGHEDSLYAARLTPDGKLLVTAGYDRHIHVWDIPVLGENGETLEIRESRASLRGHQDAVFALAIHPKGDILASASGDRTIKLWSLTAGDRRDTLSQPLGEQFTATFSPDGGTLYAAGADFRIRAWQLGPEAKEGTNRLVITRFAHESPILALVASEDGQQIFSSGEDRLVKSWNADGLGERYSLEPQPSVATALALSSDSTKLLVGRRDGTLSLYAADSGSKLRDLVPTEKPPPAPVLARVEPPLVTRGAITAVRLYGEHLGLLQEVHFSIPGLTAKLRDDTAEDGVRVVEIQTPSGTRLGPVDIEALSPGGKSNAIRLAIDDLMVRIEHEPNDHRADANEPIPLPATLVGTIGKPGDVDWYALDAVPGTTLVFDLAAQSIGSKLNAALSLVDDQGKTVASANRWDDQDDPLLVFHVPPSPSGTDQNSADDSAKVATLRYHIRVADEAFAGSPEHSYRLAMGVLPIVTGVARLSLPADQSAMVELVGHNLPEGLAVPVTAPASGTAPVPLDRNQYRFRKPLALAVSEYPETTEVEPNDLPQNASPLPIPGIGLGRINPAETTVAEAAAAEGVVRPTRHSDTDVDCWRIHSKAGQEWIIETDAAQRGSPIDTRLEILDDQGQPVERLWLVATRDSLITFRGINSIINDVRVKNWEEMELNEYLYFSGEVNRISRLPNGPDSGFLLYSGPAGRRTYFDTDRRTHALNEPCFTVEPVPPGSATAATGLPIFKLHYSNDDWSERGVRDSRIHFVAPRDGDYIIRVTDSRGQFGPRFAYRLVVRPPRPSFSITIRGKDPTVPLSAGREIIFVASRVDGFDGPIQVDVEGLPEGFAMSTPAIIEAGHLETQAVLFASSTAQAPAEEFPPPKIVARATLGDAVHTSEATLGKIRVGEAPKLRVLLDPPKVAIRPGETVTARLAIERTGFDDRVAFQIGGLPHGVYVDNIGLNGILIPKGESERTVYLTARRWVRATSRSIFAIAQVEGNIASPSITLEVIESADLAQASPATTELEPSPTENASAEAAP